MFSIRSTAWSLLIVLCTGCASAPVAPPPTAATPAPSTLPADDTLNAVVWATGTIEHDVVMRQTYALAATRLDAALADPAWNALVPSERSPESARLPPAIILDIDETVLDNTPLQSHLLALGVNADDDSFDRWWRAGVAKPLAGAREFLVEAARRGVTVFYLSNRPARVHADTERNLREQGFPLAADGSGVLLLDEPAECHRKGSGKGCRRIVVGRTHRVIFQFGDHLADFIDLPVNAPDARLAAAAPYQDWFGQRWFMLANAMYGSWEQALNPSGKRVDAETSRRHKREYLERQESPWPR